MRLLDTTTGHFIEVFDLQRRPRYAILSHTWSLEGEQTYQELKAIQETCVLASTTFPSSDPRPHPPSGSRLSQQHFKSKEPIWDDPRLSPKILMACKIARVNGYRYIWIDSCCIDKSSSSELSEAINSMYAWYRDADMCYVYLADVPDSSYSALSAPGSPFRTSRWLTRGWTLQELIAPLRIVFLSQAWTAFGTKVTLKKPLEEITGISGEVLLCKVPLDWISVARRMSWAATRETTRVEDRAYSLFGIFDVSLPTLYGEGDRAFQRLQEEILRRIPDQSLFSWSEAPFYTNVVDDFVCRRWALRENRGSYIGATHERRAFTLFASSPSAFAKSTIDAVPSDEYLQFLQPLDDGESRLFQGHLQSSFGFQLTFPVICIDNPSKTSSDSKTSYYLLILPCTTSDTRETHLLACFCCSGSRSPERLSWVQIDSRGKQIIVLKAQDIKRLRSKLRVKTFHLAHPGRTNLDPRIADPSHVFRRAARGCNMALVVSPTSRTILEAQGYDVEFYESNTRTLGDRAYDLLIYMRHDPSPRDIEAEGPSVLQPSQVLYESLKLTMTHILREAHPLTMWAVRGPHTLRLLRDLDLSTSPETGTHDPLQTTITRHVVSRHVQEGSNTTPLISFTPIQLPPSTSVNGLVETLHLTLEPDYSNDFYYVHVEISAVACEVQPLALGSSSPIQLIPARRRVHADSRERLPKVEHHLIPPWTDAEGDGDDEGVDEPNMGASESVSREGASSCSASLSEGGGSSKLVRAWAIVKSWRRL